MYLKLDFFQKEWKGSEIELEVKWTICNMIS